MSESGIQFQDMAFSQNTTYLGARCFLEGNKCVIGWFQKITLKNVGIKNKNKAFGVIVIPWKKIIKSNGQLIQITGIL